jgi:hypothetical protein
VTRCQVLFILVAACGGDDEIIPPEDRAPDAAPPVDAAPIVYDAAPPPTALRVDATATANGAGQRRVDCTVFLDIIDIEAADGSWTAFGSGEVIRTSLDGEDLLFEFSALVGGAVSLTRTDDDVQLRLVGDQPDDAAPFWLELEVVSGTADGAWTAEGGWTCSPILPGSPAEDLEIDAPGTWTLAPPPA